MKRLFGLLLSVMALLPTYSQETDMRMGELVNSEDWFALRAYYDAHGKDLQSPFIDEVAKYFIAYSFNQPDTILSIAPDLLQNHSAELGSSIFSFYYLYNSALLGKGEYAASSQLSKAFEDAYKAAGDSVSEDYRSMCYAIRYSDYCDSIGGQFLVSRPEGDITVPFEGEDQILLPGKFNGRDESFLFDTGAGVNVVVENIADELGLKPVSGLVSSVGGFGIEQAKLAFADSIQIGGMTIRNVPFCIVPVDTGHEKADSVLRKLRPVIGQPFLKKVEEVQIDFAAKTFTVPAKLTPKPSWAGNICYNTSGIFNFRMMFGEQPLTLNFDTGAQGMYLNARFYEKNREYVEKAGVRDSVRMAGIGGWLKVNTYTLPEFRGMMLDGREFVTDTISVGTDDAGKDAYDGAFGVNSCAEYRKVIINVRDMFIDFVPYLKGMDAAARPDVAELDIRLSGKVKDCGHTDFPTEVCPSPDNSPTVETRFVNRGGYVEAVTVNP